jgi:hypothetical protein
LPVVLYGCEAWSLTLRDDVLENRILRRIFGSKRDAKGAWKKTHYEELHSLYVSPSLVRIIKSRRLRWTSHLPKIEESSCAFKTLLTKLQERNL